MTEQEAREIINEARSECPTFNRGRWHYKVKRDGWTVDVYRRTPSGKTAVFHHTTNGADITVHPDIRARLQEPTP